MRSSMFAATIIAAMASVPLALAQSQQPAPPLTAPSQGPDCRRANGLPPKPGDTTGSATLSEELARSKGVICPPGGIDPGISIPPVGGGVMPVIPPPGTPGGDPNLVPK
jgi:hypothetical protein